MDYVKILLDSCRGIYIPQNFANEFKTDEFSGIEKSDLDIIKVGPDHPWYWESWQTITDNASFTEDGRQWTLYQDGDLFAIADDMPDAEREEFFEL